jgi:PKD repeat protein
MDHAFVTESGSTYDSGPQSTGKRVVEFVITPGGSLVSGPNTIVEYDGVGKATAVGLAAGPDGLYFSDLYKDLNPVTPIDSGANVLRITFVGIARFKANLTSGNAPFLVQFTDSSSAPNPSSWLWDFGDSTTSTAQNPSHIYVKEGSFNVRLTITGPRGSVSTQKNEYVSVSSGPPLATQLTSFTASLAAGFHVRLNWATISELNNYGFYVQRRTSSEPSFADLPGGFVPGHATSITEHQYSFVDTLPSPGILYYRLRQVDLDQKQQFSDTLTISVVPLATQLTSFTASLSADSRVLLNWRTITELSNHGFYVQRRSSAGQSFADLPGGFVPGHDTSIVEHQYSFVDSLAPVGTLNFRLRQVDLDQTEHFSDTVTVNIVTSVADRAPIQFTLLQNYPNPFNPQTEIKFSVDAIGRTTLNVYNTMGQQVATLFDDIAEPGRYYRIRFDGRNIASGVYFYRIQNSGRSQLRKLVLLK